MRKNNNLFFLICITVLFLLSPVLKADKVVEKDYAVVSSSGANIRYKATTKSPVIYVAHYGERLELIEDLGGWMKVKLSDGRIGFVWGPLVKIEKEKVKVIEKTVEKVVEKKVKKKKEAVKIPGTIEGKIDYGKKLYYRGKYPSAIDIFEKAISQAAPIENEGKRRSIQGEAFFFIGLCYAEKGKSEKAKDAFKSTIRLVPDYGLNVTSERYPEKILKLWRQAEDEIEEEETRKRLYKK